MPEFEDLVQRIGTSEFSEFREIRDDMVVHSRFKAEDLRLLRRVFMGYIRTGLAGSDEVRCRELYKRMLRKVK